MGKCAESQEEPGLSRKRCWSSQLFRRSTRRRCAPNCASMGVVWLGGWAPQCRDAVAAKISAHEIKERRARRCGLPVCLIVAQHFSPWGLGLHPWLTEDAAPADDRPITSAARAVHHRCRIEPRQALRGRRDRETNSRPVVVAHGGSSATCPRHKRPCLSLCVGREWRVESGVRAWGAGGWTKKTARRRIGWFNVAICCACDSSKFVCVLLKGQHFFFLDSAVQFTWAPAYLCNLAS